MQIIFHTSAREIAMKNLLAMLFMASIPYNTAFADDLMEIYQQALQNDPEFKISDINQSAAGEIKSQSIAQMLPKVGVSASSTWNRLNNEKQSFLGTGLQHYLDNLLSVNITQPVFNWGHWIQLDQSENKIAQAEAQFQAKQQDLMTRTVEAYFNVLAAQDNLEFIVAEKKAIEKQLEQAKQRFDVGIIAITDVYEAQAGFDRAHAAVIEAENQLDNRKEALREIIGNNEANLKKLPEDIPLSPPAPADIAAWSNTAESNNFSIVAQVNQAEFIRKNIELQQSKHLPTLDIVAQYRQSDNGNQFGFRGDNESVGLQFNLPLYEGGGIVSRTRQAQFEYEAAKEELTKVKRSVIRGVKDAFRGVLSSIDQVKALKSNTESGQLAVEAAEAGLEVGTRTMVDLLAIQRNLFKAKSDYAQGRYNYLINGVKLKQAAGSLSDQDLLQINEYLRN
ncbi:MAG: channel protein TolC [Methylomonas sp.]|nr:MAG: channel protein TolC [Methylomonas sp.]